MQLRFHRNRQHPTLPMYLDTYRISNSSYKRQATNGYKYVCVFLCESVANIPSISEP